MRSAAFPIMLIIALAACSREVVVSDPLATLASSESRDAELIRAMEMLDGADQQAAYETQLHRLIWVPGYRVPVRREAFDRLLVLDPEGLQRTIRQRLPRMRASHWRQELCQRIADGGWIELSDGLVSAWASRSHVSDDQRAEYRALVRLHGEDRVVDVIFEALLTNTERWQSFFRARCWSLIHRLGHRDRLMELVRSRTIPDDDEMLLTVQRSVRELGVLPHNYEEILWIQKLREPERLEFWSAARAAVASVPDAIRGGLELRDLPIVVSAAVHDPPLLKTTRRELLEEVEQRLRTGLAGIHHYRGDRRRFADLRDQLTWGDLAAMRIALQALAVPQVVDHLFDYARRDRADTTAEYGGVLDLDDGGRFVVLEFPPRARFHDQRFDAMQEMFDAGYTALFHFHFHAQRPNNAEYAGPGLGDREYAEQTRSNCLVLTSVRDGRLNVDFFRHGDMQVDLGVIDR